MSRRLWAGVSLAVLSIVALAPVASAVDAADYVLWRQWSSGRKAIVLLEDTSAGARLSAAIQGLQDGTTYEIVGTDENGSCSSGVSSANRTFVASVVGNTQANGTFQVRNVTGDDWKDTQFVRVRELGGGTWACGASNQFLGGVFVGSKVVARFAPGGELRGLVLVELLTGVRARIYVAAGDVNGDGTDDLQVRGSPKKCGVPTGTVTFAFKLENVLVSSFKSKTIDLTQDELDGLRSIRVRKLTGNSGQDWFPECQKSVLIALIIP